MASKTSQDNDQFKFLISCIRHANNSKVDFAEVAKECGIVSKGAAAKRYERMMKAHGINPSASNTRTTPSASSIPRATSGSAKKRKMEQFVEDNNQATDDDEGVRKVKAEVIDDDAEQTEVKSEDPEENGSGYNEISSQNGVAGSVGEGCGDDVVAYDESNNSRKSTPIFFGAQSGSTSKMSMIGGSFDGTSEGLSGNAIVVLD
ncbi:MAG: hypothetical protein M4579_000075 [Chaenotheca gracillima]|nr:MAG: hypothetical protein M4579_000075 [Chaenotheca gracillima]